MVTVHLPLGVLIGAGILLAIGVVFLLRLLYSVTSFAIAGMALLALFLNPAAFSDAPPKKRRS